MADFEKNPFAIKYKANLKAKRTPHSKALDGKTKENRDKTLLKILKK